MAKYGVTVEITGEATSPEDFLKNLTSALVAFDFEIVEGPEEVEEEEVESEDE